MSFLTTLGSIASPIVGSAFGPLGTLAGAGLSKVFSGIGQNATADELSAQNVRPIDAPESELLQNEAEANQRAREGMGAQQYSNAENDIARNQNLGIRTATARGGGLATIGDLVVNGNRATNDLNQRDYIDKTQNQDEAYNIRRQLAARRQQAFDWNSKQKFLENAAAIRALKASSSQNIFGGLNTFAGSPTMSTNPYTGQTSTNSGTFGNGFTGLIGKGLTGLFSGGSGGPVSGGYVDDSPIGADQSTVS